ncbi:MAG: O-antigen ligase family protein [Akkermansiaceae bacterium]|jgi:hypothetical protein|nr:O-antigen ligase family protein [Akkermansiaceae bacterium]
MSALSAIFLFVALGLAMVLGPQTLSWSWGPALLALGVSAVLAGFVRSTAGFSRAIAIPLIVAAAWIAFRCFGTPVLDDRRDDLLLLAGMLGFAWVTSRLDPAGASIRFLFAGLSLLALANGTMALLQWQNPSVIWPYETKPTVAPSGFFGHYIDFSCFMGALSLLALSRVLVSKDDWRLKSIHLLAFAVALVTIRLSEARAGLLGFGVGGAAFMVGWLIVLWRRRSKGFAPLAIALPFMLIGAVAVIWPSLRTVDATQINAGALARFSDNEARLKFYNLALEVVGRHPWVGGGSRSYGWEKNLEWNPERHGTRPESEPFVHQEFLQTAAEYGWIGAALVLVAVTALLLMQVISLFLGSRTKGADEDLDPLRVGVLSAGVAMLFQANFSFVFHLLPSALVLGILFGIGGIAVTGIRLDARVKTWRIWTAATAGVSLFAICVYHGQAGSRTLKAIWPAFYAKESLMHLDPSAAAEVFRDANAIWPGYQIAMMRANSLRAAGDDPKKSDKDRRDFYLLAVDQYREVLAMHPMSAGAAINLANTLSIIDRDDEAEAAFIDAIRIQGGLEGAYQANFWFATHLNYLWSKRWKERRAGDALSGFQRAITVLDEADRLGHWDNKDQRQKLREEIRGKIEFLEGAGIKPTPASGP